MMYWNDGSWGWGGWLVMCLSMLAFWGLLAWLALSLFRSSGNRDQRHPATPPPTPEELLAERFARGEIDETDYRQRNEVLRKERAHAG